MRTPQPNNSGHGSATRGRPDSSLGASGIVKVLENRAKCSGPHMFNVPSVSTRTLIDADLRSSIGETAAELMTKQDIILKIAGAGARDASIRGRSTKGTSTPNPADKVRKAATGQGFMKLKDVGVTLE